MEIKTFSPTSHKIKAVIYGSSGSGKTFFAASAPKPIFASAESGLLSTIKRKNEDGTPKPIHYVEIKKMDDLRDLLQYLQKGLHGFETVVIDSISEINEIIKEGIEKKRGAQMQLKDWNDLSKAIKGILRGFRDLNMHVIFIAQEKAEKDDQKTEKYVPMLNGKQATEIAYFMDIVAYSFIDKIGEHKITATPSEKLLTKCRGIELPADAPDDFSAWIEAMDKIVLKDEEVTTIEPPKKVVATAPKVTTNPTLRIQAITSKAMYAEWAKFYEGTGNDPKQSSATLVATIKKEFGKESSRELTEVQALSFVERLKTANKKRVETSKALEIETVDHVADEEKKVEEKPLVDPNVQEPPKAEEKVEEPKEDLKNETPNDTIQS